ncbi:GNAT family N-acetyltransferase [Streptomyces sp. NPDC048445]|uniref:GNAT family N-acetyltransferase n=1 Tax=Streptomyces sp. NPDC048445 TaxID=3365553 RepID=UPI003718CF9A
MDEGFRLREATTEDVDTLTDVHTRTRTAYYTAGGMPDQELAAPDAWVERRDAWARVLATSTRTTLCAEDSDGSVVGLLTVGPPHHEELGSATHYELYQIGVLPHAWGHGVGGALTGSSSCGQPPRGVLRECWSAGRPTLVRSASTPGTAGGRTVRGVRAPWTATTSGCG